jgi:ubiquinone/menaquinone biosynthesis C-methylase UbiE
VTGQVTDPGSFFDHGAELYDAAHDHGSTEANALRVRMAVVSRLLGPDPGRVIDCGMGPGRLLVELERRGWSVAGVDVSGEMVARARERVPKAADQLLQASVESLPFASESFDAAVSTGVLEYVDDVPCALAEVVRVLRPGGLFVASMPNSRALHTVWRHRILYPAVRAAKARFRFGRPMPLHRPGFLSLGRFEELAGYAGLEVERIEYIALPIPAPLRRVLPPRVSRIVTRLDVVGSRLGPLFGKQFVVAARKYQRPA